MASPVSGCPVPPASAAIRLARLVRRAPNRTLLLPRARSARSRTARAVRRARVHQGLLLRAQGRCLLRLPLLLLLLLWLVLLLLLLLLRPLLHQWLWLQLLRLHQLPLARLKAARSGRKLLARRRARRAPCHLAGSSEGSSSTITYQ